MLLDLSRPERLADHRIDGMGRALLVWLALVVCALLIEPLGFLLAGEVLVLLVIVVIERIRSIPLIITLLLLPPAN